MIAYSAKKRIFLHGYFMQGFPDEKLAELLRTAWFARNLKLHTAIFSVVHGYKGIELSKNLLEECLVSEDNALSDYASSANFVNCSSYNKMVIIFVRQLANILFYLDFYRMFRILRDLPNRKIIGILIKKFMERILLLK